MENYQSHLLNPQGRLSSLDVFRGLTMFLLVLDGTRLYRLVLNSDLKATLGPLFTQLTHHPWNGLHFWDLVQPFFMFIVGVAMPFSFARRWGRGDDFAVAFRHAATRSLILLGLGITVYIVQAGRPVFELWNVLAQLSVTYLIAFVMMRRSTRTQILVSFSMIAITELAYRLWWVPGYDQPFAPTDQNFGSWVDMLLMGKVSKGHWVAVNAIPTTAHTMWGVLAGFVLMSQREPMKKIKILATAGLIGVVIGYGLDPITPIIKRICTSSFVIVSGGWCFLALALCFWLVDVKGYRKWTHIAVIFGMNPLFIYLFSLLGGAKWLKTIVEPFTTGFLAGSETSVAIVTAILVFSMECYLVHFMYRRKVFIRI